MNYLSNFQVWLDLVWRSEQSLISLGPVTCPAACTRGAHLPWLTADLPWPPAPSLFCSSHSLGPGCLLEKSVGGGYWTFFSCQFRHMEGAERWAIPSCWPFNGDIVQLYRLSAQNAAIYCLEIQSRARGLRFVSPQDNSELLASFSEAAASWWDAACLESARKGGVETGLLTITRNPYPL